MKLIRTENAVGQILCHDITKIVPGEFKGRAFKKGHIITEADIPELLKLGKENLYVWELQEGFLHENDAGLKLACGVCGQGLSLTEPKEGKVNLVAEYDGLLVIEEELLLKINMIDEMVVSTRNNLRPVKKGDIVCGLRVVPLLVSEDKVKMAEDIAQTAKIVKILPFAPMKTGIITTGSEVFHGRIKDGFGPIVKKKVEAYGCSVINQIIVPDNAEEIAAAAKELLNAGAELILTTGGMSVDPDDMTPTGIKLAGAQIITYGAPVLPGAMMLVGYIGKVPVLGLPGCVMYHRTTIFDLLLPVILAQKPITKPMVAKLGLGGLCLECVICHYPACAFGTGA